MNMATNNMPVNIDILTVTEQDLQRLQQVKELQIFSQGNVFHPEGLFSTTIFGSVGSEYRNRMFGYIDLKYPVLHPAIYQAIVSTKAYYEQIINGSVTAIYDPKSKSFIKSTDEKASTGYTFFMSHIEELEYELTNSDKRTFNIRLIKEAISKNKHLLRYLLVMPAGLRDYTVNTNGKPEEDEINSYYRRLLAQSQLIDPTIAKKTPEVYDNIYSVIQKNLNDLYNYIKSLLEGKSKLILGKWLSRKVYNSTRNVLTSFVDTSTNINNPNRLKSNETGASMYQYLRSCAPKTLYEIKNTYVSKIFVEGMNSAYLTNVKTLKKEEVMNNHIQKDIDQWTTMDGLESVIANFGNIDIRHLPITLNKGKHYMGLVYNDGKYVKFLQDINELPDGFNKENVSPITMAEFLYMSIYKLNGKIPGFVTRYPINGYGGIYPAWIKINTTSTYQELILLDDNWEKTDEVLVNFPVKDSEFLDGMTVHQSHMALLGSDFDGDTTSLVGVITDEAVEEVKKVLNSKTYYINNENRVIFSNSSDVIDSVLSYMTV